MRKFGRALAGLVMSAAALVVSPEMPGWADSMEAAQNEIRSTLEKWRSAFNDRDDRRVCDLFAADLVANYQGAPERSYASLCQTLQTALQDPDRTYLYSLNINEILVYGETAIARLVWTLEIEKGGASKETVEETAVDIFRHQPDGSWKISRYLAYPASP
jgi:steroid delta-isomerase